MGLLLHRWLYLRYPGDTMKMQNYIAADLWVIEGTKGNLILVTIENPVFS